MIYIHVPSVLKVMSFGAKAVGIRPVTFRALAPVRGMTAIEFAPLFTAYSVLPSRDSVTLIGAAPVWATGITPAGARVSMFAVTVLVAVSITATWSVLSCATYRVVPAAFKVMP